MRAPPDSQGDLFPRCSSATVLLYLARAARRVAQRADRLTPDDCHQLLGELALLELRLDRIDRGLELADRFTRTPAPASAPVPGPSWIHGPNPPAWAHRARAEAAAP